VFVQVIQGRVSDAAVLRDRFENWMSQLAPGSIGWLGTTAGVAEDGRFITLVRFETEDAARQNSDRPEQGQWWAETSTLIEGEATFKDSSDVDLDIHGDPDRAGFVQVMQGRTTDPERARQIMSQGQDKWRDFRPDVIGSVSVGHDGGQWTTAIYFTSEAEAREGERKEMPPELQAQMDEMQKLSVGEPEFLDLKDPWLYSPR
jgi:hypothetical protein